MSTFEDAVLPMPRPTSSLPPTSFHWVDTEIGMEKVLAALRPGGWIAFWWNLWYDPAGPDVFSQALDPVFASSATARAPLTWTRTRRSTGCR